MTRTRWVCLWVACAVVVVVALVVGAVVYFSTAHRAARMADRIGVSVPDNATDLQVDDPPFALQGNCSTMAFLIPTNEWQAYVARYFDLNTLGAPDMLREFCGQTLVTCVDDIYVKGYVVHGDYDGVKRGLTVTPDCIDGKARIAWGTTD